VEDVARVNRAGGELGRVRDSVVSGSMVDVSPSERSPQAAPPTIAE